MHRAAAACLGNTGLQLCVGERTEVARDGSSANVDVLGEFCIAQVGQVAHIAASPDVRILQLAEVAYVGARTHHRTRSQPRKWANAAVGRQG